MEVMIAIGLSLAAGAIYACLLGWRNRDARARTAKYKAERERATRAIATTDFETRLRRRRG